MNKVRIKSTVTETGDLVQLRSKVITKTSTPSVFLSISISDFVSMFLSLQARHCTLQELFHFILKHSPLRQETIPTLHIRNGGRGIE